MTLIIATRPSPFARAQTAHVIRLLRTVYPDLKCQEQIIATKGDCLTEQSLPSIGEEGFFTKELEMALLSGEVNVAVHSLKDLPLNETPGLVIAAIPGRDYVFDVLLSANGQSLANLPQAACVGVNNLRRSAQLLAYRPDLTIVPLRGNTNTQMCKLMNGDYDAIVLASGRLAYLGMTVPIPETLPLDVMLPAPGQGALAIQCRADDREILELLATIHNPLALASVSAERAFLAGLGGQFSLPVGAFAQKKDGQIILTGAVISVDGKRAIRLSAADQEPHQLGMRLAQFVLERGASDLLHPLS